MKKLTQKLVLSVLTMTLVVIALGTSTFAWFTLTNSAEVGTFTGQVVAGTGIEVSLDGYSWYNGLTSTQMQQYLFDGGFTVYTSPTSSNTNAKYGAGFRWDAITSKDGVNLINLDESAAATSKYIEFTLYFRTEAVGTTIAWSEVLLGGTAAAWNPDASFLGSTGENIAIGTPYTVQALNGARVSVTGDSTVIYQAAASTGSASTSGNQTTFGYVAGGQAKYWEAKNVGTTFATYVLAQTAGLTTPYSAPATGVGEDFELAAATVSSVSNSTDVVLLDTVSGVYNTGSVTVRVWLEGWDADTFNALFNKQLSVQLKFEVAA